MRKTLLILLFFSGVLGANAQIGTRLWQKPTYGADMRPDESLLFKREDLEKFDTPLNDGPKSSAGVNMLPFSYYGRRVGYTAHDWQFTTSTANTVVKLNDGSLGVVWQFGRRASVGSRQIGFNYRNSQGVWCINADAPLTAADSFRFALAGDNAQGISGPVSHQIIPGTPQYGRTRNQFLLPINGNTNFRSFGLTFGGGNDSLIAASRISDYIFTSPGCRPANGLTLNRRSAIAYTPSLASDGNNTIYGVTYTNDTVGLGLPAFIACGNQNPLALIKSTDQGNTWTTKIIPNLYRSLGFGSAHTMGGYAIDVKGNQLAIVANIMLPGPDFGIATVLLRSFDGGDNFSTHIIDKAVKSDTNRSFDISQNGNRAALLNDNHFSITIAPNNVVHITTSRGYLISDSAAQAFEFGYRNGGFTNRSAGRLMYWNSTMGSDGWVFPSGVNFVDTDNSGFINFPTSGPTMPGDYLHAAMSQSTMAYDQQGRLYVVYSALVEGTENCCNSKTTRDIYVTATSDGGKTWTNPINVAALAGAEDGVSGGSGSSEDVFPTINRVITQDDSLHIFWMVDEIAGLQSNGVFQPGYTQLNWRMNSIYNFNLHTSHIWGRKAGVTLPEGACLGNSFNATLHIPANYTAINGQSLSVPPGTVWTVQLDTSWIGYFTPTVNISLGVDVPNTVFNLGTITSNTAGPNVISCTIPSNVKLGSHKIRIISNFQDPFDILGNNVFYASGTYDITIGQTGSIIVPSVITAGGPTSFCPGGSVTLTAPSGFRYLWSNNETTQSITVDTSGSYTVQTIADACNSTLSAPVIVSLFDTTATRITGAICPGEQFTFGSQTLTALGTYKRVVTSSKGCDSTIILTLNLRDTVTRINSSICKGQSLTFGNQILTQPGNYRRLLQSNFGCDSVIRLTLNVLDTSTTSISESICQGQSLPFGNQNLIVAGSYRRLLQNSLGCDSAINLTLSVRDTSPITPFSDTICQGESVNFGNSTLSQRGLYRRVLPNAVGCDSAITLKLIVLDTVTTILQYICPGQSFNFGNQLLTAAGTYRRVLKNILGCDSSIILNLTFLDTLTILNESVCRGQAYQFGNQSINTAGTYRRVLINSLGCDSAVVLNLSLRDTASTSISESVCRGQTYQFGTQTLGTAGSYRRVLTNALGCDSAVILNLSIRDTSSTSISESVCRGQTYQFGTQTLGTAGTYRRVLTNALGCDSAVVLNLSLRDTSTTSITEVICKGRFYQFGNQSLNTAGTYRRVLTNSLGCDSSIVLNLTVRDTLGTITQSICKGQSFVFGNQTLTASGTYRRTLPNSIGCDSTVILSLNVRDTSFSETSVVACQGDVIPFGSGNIIASGSYIRRVTNAIGCDSSIRLVALFKPYPSTNTVVGQNGARAVARGANLVHLWQRIGGGIISTTDSLTAINGGNFRLIIADTAFGVICADTSNPFVILSSGPNLSNVTWSAYPNPANDFVTLEGVPEEAEIQLISSIGINYPLIREAAERVSLRGVPAGVYLLEIRTDTHLKRLRLTVQR